MKLCSSIVKLDPFTDDEGILTVKGRIQMSALANEMQHLVPLPKSYRIADLRGRLQQQKMTDLPKERMSEEPPFTYCGVNLFGLFLVKDGRKEVKRCGVLYTCLATRAIYIEVVYSLSTDLYLIYSS